MGCARRSSCIRFTFYIAWLPLVCGVPRTARESSSVAAVEVTGSGPLKWSPSASATPSEPLVRRDVRSITDGSKEQLKREQPIIPGHLFAGLAQDTHRGVGGPHCATAPNAGEGCCTVCMSKAANMVSDMVSDMEQNQTSLLENADELPRLRKLLKEIMEKLVGPKLRRELVRALLKYDAGGAIKRGHMWTNDDEHDWTCCNFDLAAGSPCPTLEDNNATGITQGDIAVDDEETQGMLLEAAITGKRWGGNVWPKTTQSEHWIAYCYSSAAKQSVKDSFEAAVKHIEEQVPCIKFKAVKAVSCNNEWPAAVGECCSEFPSIIIQDEKVPRSGCWSHVGQKTQHPASSQPLNLDDGCDILGIAAHEIGHALGLLHEMSRNDRDEYVTINHGNIDELMLPNFKNQTHAYVGTAFDFLSLMMYGAYTFTINGEVTIMPRDVRLIALMGQRMGFSELDVMHLGEMYSCVDSVVPKTQNKMLSEAYLKGEGFEEFKGLCVDEEITGFIRDGTANENMPCEELRGYCRHTTRGEEIRKICPVSCFLCIPDEHNTKEVAEPSPDSARPARLRSPVLMGVALVLGLGLSAAP